MDNFTNLGGPTRRYFYTSISYVLSSNAARSLVNFVQTYGFRKAADHTLYRVMEWSPNRAMPQYEATRPLLIRVPPRIDTDVNHESNMLDDDKSECAAGDTSCNSRAASVTPPSKRVTNR